MVRRASRKRLGTYARAHYALVTFDLPFVNAHEFESVLADRDSDMAYVGDYPTVAQRVALV